MLNIKVKKFEQGSTEIKTGNIRGHSQDFSSKRSFETYTHHV